MNITRYCFPEVPEGLEGLIELALDLRWSWNYAADALWRRLSPDVWDLTRNPWLILQTVARTTLESLGRDERFRHTLEEQVRTRREYLDAPGWFATAHPGAPLTLAAYFSMEFGLSEALPIYSGGLGLLAGDHLKTASDLGVPLVGIGLLYQQGYFRQALNAEGGQFELFPHNDPGQLPVLPVRDESGEWLRVRIGFPGRTVLLRVWSAKVGRVTLYLMDSNDPMNAPADRGITGQLYSGGSEQRLQQEIALGIGGARLLGMLGLRPEIYHLNEGHAAFAVLERARTLMRETGQSFSTALAITRAGNVFTTHTPVAAGFDQFDPSLVRQYLGGYADELSIGVEGLLALGCEHSSSGCREPLNMAFLAIRGSGAVNGVSRLHGEVSRRLFARLFPRWPIAEVPVGSVTNGVHVPSWDSAEADQIWEQACGPDRWMGALENVERGIRSVPDDRLWELRSRARRELIGYARARLARELAEMGAAAEEVARAENLFDPNTLTLGFARRFTAYKRPNLLLRDPERLIRLLTGAHRPVQLVIAGKAHPQDQAGKDMVREWVQFVRRPEVRLHALFLTDYDMLLAERLVQGVDVWINTPRRPSEASGTSGMKVLVNGGLNLSELDGWWAEAYQPGVGWAIGDGQEHGDDPAWDEADAEALYTVLEREVVPAFYSRNGAGVPAAWLTRMRESMARLTPAFSTNRMVREYVEGYYLPGAAAYRDRAADGGRAGAELAGWLDAVARHWGSLHLGELRVETAGGFHKFEMPVDSGGLDAGALRVELYAESPDGGPPVREPMRRSGNLYSAVVSAARPAADYTPRVVPVHKDLAVPLEAGEILWQR